MPFPVRRRRNCLRLYTGDSPRQTAASAVHLGDGTRCAPPSEGNASFCLSKEGDMSNRKPICATALFIAIFTVLKPADALEPNNLAALAVRQDLRNAVCVAMADGKLNRLERFVIFSDAKQILDPKEYESFKRNVDRLSPPKPTAAKALAAKPKSAPTRAARMQSIRITVTDPGKTGMDSASQEKQRRSMPFGNVARLFPVASSGDVR
jgi:hypothetical protein